MGLDRLTRVAFLLVIAGLLLQIATSFFWSPGAFITSAAVGLPMVVAGAGGVWVGVHRSIRARRGGREGDRPDA
jgi:hypothetical protein